MTLDYLKEHWKRADSYTTEAASEMWNKRAEDFRKKKLPTSEENAFFKLIMDRVQPNKEMSALDIGCGTGIYSLALAPHVGQAVGCDVADKMIDIANAQAQEIGIDNVFFACNDWQTLDIDEWGYRGKFDIVIAHMTPAINDFDTIEKMVACAKKHCFMRKPTRRTEPVMDHALGLIGLRRERKSDADFMEYLFSYLWSKGFEPHFEYQKGNIIHDRTVVQTLNWILDWANHQRPVTAEDEKIVRNYLESLAVDDNVHECIESTFITIDWAV